MAEELVGKIGGMISVGMTCNLYIVVAIRLISQHRENCILLSCWSMK